LVDSILPLVGLDQPLDRGAEVADIGCGQGHAVNLMAKAYPNSMFTGFDFSDERVTAARREAESWGLRNARFEVKDVASLGISNRFDIVTSFDAIHDQAQPDKVLRNIWEALKPGGIHFMLDEAGSSNLEENLDHPLGPLSLRRLGPALHNGVAGAGRRRSRHHVGRADCSPNARRSRISQRGDQEVRGMHVLPLKVLDDLHFARAAIVECLDLRRYAGEAGKPRRTEPPRSHYQLEVLAQGS
jgi:SAM-dependent methyltransferase